MERNIIAARLSHFTGHYAATRGYVFGEGVEHMLPQLASDMAQRVIDRARQEKTPEEGLIRLAEGNLIVFVDAMINAGKRERGYFAQRGPVIGEMTWAKAMAKICPLFPLC